MASRGPATHGTRAGYQAHRREGTDPCKACRAANTEYVKSRNRSAPPAPPPQPPPPSKPWRMRSTIDPRWDRSGVNGYDPNLIDMLTVLYGEPPDDLWVVQGRDALAPKRTVPVTHGTRAGYRAHLAACERPCDACNTANNDYSREAKRKARTKPTPG